LKARSSIRKGTGAKKHKSAVKKNSVAVKGYDRDRKKKLAAVPRLNAKSISGHSGLNSAPILADASSKPEGQMTSLEKMDVSRLGIRKKDLQKLKEKTRLDYTRLAKALSVTRVTLIRKKKQEKFNSALSERIVGLADIYSYGYEVFEDEDRFNEWMLQPNSALGGQPPYDLIDNQFGREEVRNIIGRIDHGVYS